MKLIRLAERWFTNTHQPVLSFLRRTTTPIATPFGPSAWRSNAKLKAEGEKRILKQFPDDPRTRWADWKKRPDVFVS